MSTSRQANMLKVVILGDGGVGKSSLMNRFVKDSFDGDAYHTMGVEFLNKELNVGTNTFVLQIWDTAGQERFRSLRTPFYRGSDCCMLTYDVTNRDSFTSLESWRQEFIEHADVDDPSQFPFVVLGNKVDSSQTRVVTAEEAKEWCKSVGIAEYYETSAKENKNVEAAFRAAAEEIKRKGGHVESPKYGTTININEPKNKGCC